MGRWRSNVSFVFDKAVGKHDLHHPPSSAELGSLTHPAIGRAGELKASIQGRAGSFTLTRWCVGSCHWWAHVEREEALGGDCQVRAVSYHKLIISQIAYCLWCQMGVDKV